MYASSNQLQAIEVAAGFLFTLRTVRLDIPDICVLLDFGFDQPPEFVNDPKFLSITAGKAYLKPFGQTYSMFEKKVPKSWAESQRACYDEARIRIINNTWQHFQNILDRYDPYGEATE
jgi:hypothetical protein